MDRGMTAAAFNEYLQQDSDLADLAGKLEPGVVPKSWPHVVELKKAVSR